MPASLVFCPRVKGVDKRLGTGLVGHTFCPSGAMVAHPICNREVSGFESPLGLVKAKYEVVSRILESGKRCAKLTIGMIWSGG